LELFDRHGIGAIVLDGDTQLGTLYPKGGVLGDKDGRRLLMEVETCGQDSVIRRQRIEDGRKTVRHDAIEFDPEGPTTGHGDRLPQPARARRAEILQQADCGSRIGPYLIHSGLLPVELLDHDQREDNIVLVESER
jgi:hypothetical protein